MMDNNLDLKGNYQLSEDQINQYQQNGYILLQNVANQSELNVFRKKIVDIVDEVNKKNDTQGRIDNYNKMFTQVTNVWIQKKELEEFIFASKFAKIAADLMKVNGTRLYHDQALIKEKGGQQTPWHRDYYYWPLDTTNSITMWMPLVDCPKEMGTMTFGKQTHAMSNLQKMPISETSQQYFDNFIKENNVELQTFDLKAGDATFHSGLTLHSAHPNQYDIRREVITIIFFEDGVKIVSEDQLNEHRKVDLNVFCPGKKSGEIADTELNPLLYSRNI